MGPLRDKYAKLFLFTGDTLGNGARIAEELGLQVRITPNAESKAAEAKKLRPETTATIGNGRIDLELFQTVKLAIAALQGEGLHGSLLWVPDIIIVPTINDGLDLLLKEKRLIATLRK
jgi:soluble P-type ATPase